VSAVDANGNPVGDEQMQKRQRVKYKAGGGERTLESQKNISLECFDVAHEKDPLFKRTTQKFDEMRVGNLMTATLSTTPNLLLQLDSKMAYHSSLKEAEQLKSDEAVASTTSSKNKNVTSNYIDIFRR